MVLLSSEQTMHKFVHEFEEILWWSICLQVRRGGFEGVRANPPFDLQKTAHFKYPTIWKWSTSLAASEDRRCPNKSGYSYSTGVCEFIHGGPVQNAGVTCSRRCNERTQVITCVNKSLVHALKSCLSSEVTPRTCCSANLRPGLVSSKIRSQLAYM